LRLWPILPCCHLHVLRISASSSKLAKGTFSINLTYLLIGSLTCQLQHHCGLVFPSLPIDMDIYQQTLLSILPLQRQEVYEVIYVQNLPSYALSQPLILYLWLVNFEFSLNVPNVAFPVHPRHLRLLESCLGHQFSC
jgi:hypothetical protein